MPQPSLFTTHKPWRCPNPGCNKAYKQSNGLKYHQQKGQCDFAIHDAVDLGLSIEEAEERSRPFVCAVGAGCTKRYRQMNGLKYHYLNSGEHGKYGLRMLQNGTHPQPAGVAALAKKPTPTNTPLRPSGAPYQIPSQLGQTRPLGHLAGGGPVGGNGQGGLPRPGGFGSGSGGPGQAPGQGQGQGHGLPRMGVFPSTQHNRPPGGPGVPGAPGQASGSNFPSMNRPVPGSGMGVNGVRPGGVGAGSGMAIRNGNGVPGSSGNGHQSGTGPNANSGGPLSGSGAGSGTNGANNNGFARPPVGQIPPHRPQQSNHNYSNAHNSGSNAPGQGNSQQGRPPVPQISGFPPLRSNMPNSQGQSTSAMNRPPQSGSQRPPMSTQTHQSQNQQPQQQQQQQSQTQPKSATVPNELPVQRGRDAVLFAAVETMDL